MNEIRNSGVNFSTVSLGQIQQVSQSAAPKQAAELETLLNRTLGNSTTLSSANHDLSLDTVMSGSLSGYLGLGANALEGLESPIASSQVLASPQAVAATVFEPSKVSSAVLPEDSPLTGLLPQETLSSVAFSMDVNEVALGLVPGASFTPSQGYAIASVTEQKVVPAEFTAMNLQEKDNFVLSSLPVETLSGWDNQGNLAADGGKNLGLSLEVPESLSALALAKGETFDARPLASVPFVEGNRSSYDAAWNNVFDTLSAYEPASAQGMVGLGDVWNQNSQGISSSRFSLGFDAETDGVGIEKSLKSNDELLGYRSFVSRELLGFIDLSPYSSSIAMNVNPTSVSSTLKPGKYISNLLYGYNA